MTDTDGGAHHCRQGADVIGGVNDLAISGSYGGAMSADTPFAADRQVDAIHPALPASVYRRISFIAWAAVLAVGTVCWAAFFYLI